MHRHGPSRPRLARRRHVARNAGAQADVAEAPPPGNLGTGGPASSTSPTILTWKASGSTARSHCTLTCKWTWIGGAGGWQHDFLASVGLEDLLDRGGLPVEASPIGTDLGPLTPSAAAELGLTTRCRVGVGLIDAHAGALGTLAAHAGDFATLERHLCLVAGTSSCVMALSADARPIHAVWGPYEGAVLPGTWLNEAGQSATGALLDHLVRCTPPAANRHRNAIATSSPASMRCGPATGTRLPACLHVVPDFHGNRSPLADPLARGVISGLTLDTDFDSLCRLYWRAAVGIALGIRHILETLGGHGYGIGTLHVTGGHTRNPLLMELYADATGCTVIAARGRGCDAARHRHRRRHRGRALSHPARRRPRDAAGRHRPGSRPRTPRRL